MTCLIGREIYKIIKEDVNNACDNLIKKANELGVKVIDENEFLSWIDQNGIN